MEIWRDIDGYAGYYQVSNKGRIRSLDRTIFFSDGRVRKYAGQILKRNSKTSSGYKQCILKVNGVSKYAYIHRLVAQAFIDNPENKKEVNHINGDKNDNSVENLEWVTASENDYHAVRTGLRKPSEKQRAVARYYGKLNGKPVRQFSRTGELINRYASAFEADDAMGFRRGSVSEACCGKCKTRGGFVWRYEIETAGI